MTSSNGSEISASDGCRARNCVRALFRSDVSKRVCLPLARLIFPEKCAVKVGGEVPHWTHVFRFSPQCFRNCRGGFFKEIHSQRCVSEEAFAVSHSARAYFASHRENLEINCPPEPVHGIQKKSSRPARS